MEVTSTIVISGEEREIADAYAREQITTLSSDTSSMKEKINAITQDVSGLSSDASDITVGISTGLFGGWKKVDIGGTYDVYAMNFIDNKFVAIARGASYGEEIYEPILLISEDGLVWEKYSDIVRSMYDDYNLVYGTEILLTAGSSYYVQRMLKSKISSKWYEEAVGDYREENIEGIAYGNEMFVVLKRDGNVYYANESESYTWNKASTVGDGSNYTYDIEYGNGLFIVVGDNGLMYKSSDLVTWTAVDSSVLPSSRIHRIQYCNNKFFAFASRRMFYSDDATNWTEGYTFPNPVYRISYGRGKYVVCGNNGMIAYSEDITNWTVCTCGTDDLMHVAFGNGEFVVTGYNGSVYRSDVLRNYRNLEDVINEILQTT